jgi:hypothetical protein
VGWLPGPVPDRRHLPPDSLPCTLPLRDPRLACSGTHHHTFPPALLPSTLFLPRSTAISQRQKLPISGATQTLCSASQLTARDSAFKALSHLLPTLYFSFYIPISPISSEPRARHVDRRGSLYRPQGRWRVCPLPQGQDQVRLRQWPRSLQELRQGHARMLSALGEHGSSSRPHPGSSLQRAAGTSRVSPGLRRCRRFRCQTASSRLRTSRLI